MLDGARVAICEQRSLVAEGIGVATVVVEQTALAEMAQHELPDAAEKCRDVFVVWPVRWMKLQRFIAGLADTPSNSTT